MTSSSSPPFERGLDTTLIVFSLLHGHPASTPCENFISSRSGWFTSVLAITEAKAVLTKVYGVDSALAAQKLTQFSAGPIAVIDLDKISLGAGWQLADVHRLDLTDAVLLHLAQHFSATFLATEDQTLAQTCGRLGITPESPFDALLQKQVAAWEKTNLSPKGLPRILRRVFQWLSHGHPQAAQDFWSQTGGGSHLP